ncbi:MAG: winged helix-turn-helix transcriptional regulator [Promethearchaeota archaeon]|nr:MAG: winged helix-turn-helix transcriptional regulator [Candidatus Lokiarchaeota archaeon]
MDENDLKILEILDEDSRTPYDLIGKRVNLTGNAVRTRVIRMIEDGVIERFIFKIHPSIFEVSSCFVYFKYPQSGNIAEIINKKIGHDPHFCEIISGYDPSYQGNDGSVIVYVMGSGNEDLEKHVEKLKRKINDVSEFLVIKRYTPPVEKVKINNSLLKVIYALIKDVRTSVATLAKDCKMTSKSVKYYLDQITRFKIGRFSINTQPNKISQRIFINLYISKENMDYIRFEQLFDSILREIKSAIFNNQLLVDPPGVYCEVTTESLEEIDLIEHKIRSFMKEDYTFNKMFPSKIIYRNSLIQKIVEDRMVSLDKLTD